METTLKYVDPKMKEFKDVVKELFNSCKYTVPEIAKKLDLPKGRVQGCLGWLRLNGHVGFKDSDGKWLRKPLTQKEIFERKNKDKRKKAKHYLHNKAVNNNSEIPITTMNPDKKRKLKKEVREKLNGGVEAQTTLESYLAGINDLPIEPQADETISIKHVEMLIEIMHKVIKG